MENMNTNKDYIAIDIGASSGRLIHGYLKEGKIKLEEIHRFKNGFHFINQHERWDIDYLIREIFLGLEKAKRKGLDEVVIGIDTWAVDYVLLRENGEKIADPISYRDPRTKNVMPELFARVSKEKIYEKTGIQFLEFNTLYQLYAEDKYLLKKASKLLFIPDYIGYVLTGKKVTEVTNASTTQMLNIRAELFDDDLLNAINVQADLFPPLVDAGTRLGSVQEKWYDQYDIPKAEVVTVASHDTASAVLGVPSMNQKGNWAYISSGTWSLIGVESKVPINTPKAFENNFTNEWGAYGTYRFLKNIMGMWMVQEVKRLFKDGQYEFSEMAKEAMKTPFFESVIDINDSRFINPENMIDEIQKACDEENLPLPNTVGELTNCVYSSLAIAYASEIAHLNEITGKNIEELYIVGGGSNIDILNQLTADLANIKVYSGPNEATAIGNIIVQMIQSAEIKDIDEARNIIRNSFQIKKFNPVK